MQRKINLSMAESALANHVMAAVWALEALKEGEAWGDMEGWIEDARQHAAEARFWYAEFRKHRN